MTIKDTKKPESERTNQSNKANGLELKGSQNKRTLLYFNENTGISQQDAYTGSRNVKTYFFDRDEYKDLPESLQRTGNAIAFEQSEVRTADKIAHQLNMAVRKFFKNVEILRSNYDILVIGDNHKPQGMFIAINAIEAQRYLSQQKARGDRRAKAWHGVENGLKNGFLEQVNQWIKPRGGK